MEKTRGRVELFVGMLEAQPCEQSARGNVVGIVAGKDRIDTIESESILDNARCGLEGIAVSPVTRCHVNAEFGNLRLLLARSKTAAADMLPGGKKEDRPILDAVTALSLDFALQPGLHFVPRVALGSDVPCNGGIAPEIDGEIDVGVTPAAETEPRRLQEVITHTHTVPRAAARATRAARRAGLGPVKA